MKLFFLSYAARAEKKIKDKKQMIDELKGRKKRAIPMTICLERQITSNYQEELSSLLFFHQPFQSSTYLTIERTNEREENVCRIYSPIDNEKESKPSIVEHVII